MESPIHPVSRPRPHLPFQSIAFAILAICVAAGPLACQGNLQSRLTEIQALQDAGEWEASIEPLRELLSDNSSHPEINYRLGVAMMQTGRRSLAVWPLQKASQSEEYAVQAGLLLTTTLLGTDDYDEAVRAADRVLAIDPENTSALYARAHANIANHQPETAATDAQRVLDILPGDARATTLLLGALIDLERFDEADALHKDLMRITEESGDLDKAARSCGAYAKFQLQYQTKDAAEKTYVDCLQKYPDSAPLRSWLSEFYVDDNRIEDASRLWQEAIDERPESPELRMRLAKLLEKGGRPAEAGKVYEENVDLFDTLQAWKALADFRSRTGNASGAREAIQKAIERAPGDTAPLRYELADLYVVEGELDRARELATELDEPAYKDLLEGRILLADGKPKEALQHFDTGLRRWPNNANARYLAALAAQELGDEERALAEFREAVRADQSGTDASLRLAEAYFEEGSYEAALPFAIRHIEYRPIRSADAHVIAARSAYAMGDREEAELRLNELLHYKSFAHVAWAELADLARRQLGPERALAVAEQSQLDPTDPKNLDLLRGMLGDLVATGDGARAVALADRAIQREDTDEIGDLRARTLAAMGRGDEARTAFQSLIARSPDFASAHEGLGQLARQAGDLEGALAHFDKAASLDSSSADALYGAAHTMLAQGRKGDAIEQFRAANAAQPSHAGAANDLAWFLAEEGKDLDQALALAKRASRSDPSANTLDTLGYVHLQRGDGQNAENALRRGIENFGGGASLRYRLGLALAKQNKRDAAAAEFRRALEGGPFPEADEARRKLAEYGK